MGCKTKNIAFQLVLILQQCRKTNYFVARLTVASTFLYVGSTASCLDNQVAVVGGGVAGLAAASSLSEAGFDVVLLEAADYFGGRVKQAQPFNGFAPVDLGGEVIHGSDTIINRIAEENDWPLEPVRRLGFHLYLLCGRFRGRFPDVI